MRRLGLVALAFAASVCAGFAPAWGDQPSLADQRAAVKAVKVTAAVPPGASVIGNLTKTLCRSTVMDKPPTDAEVTNELVMAAFAKGADGIANVRIRQGPASAAVLKGCWSMREGEATMYVIDASGPAPAN